MWEFTSHNNEKCETIFNEGWCESLHHITIGSVRLYSVKGGLRVEVMNVAWGLSWGESRSTKPRVFPRWEVPRVCGVRLGWFQGRIGSSSVFCNEWLFMCAWFYAFVDSLAADRIVVAAWLLSCFVAMCVNRCMLATWCCKTHCNGCMNVAWAWFGEKAGAPNLVFFCKKWLQRRWKVPRVCGGCGCGRFKVESVPPLAVFCNEWLFMCAWFYPFVDSLVADRSAMAALRLLGATAACVILLSFAAGHRGSYWSGCIRAAIVICRRFFSVWALVIFPFNFLFKSASEAVLPGPVFGAAIFDTVAHSSIVFCKSVSADRIVMAASRLLGVTAACVILLSFAAGHRKT